MNTDTILDIAKENEYDIRRTTGKIIKAYELEYLAYSYNYYVYETFMETFGDNVCQNNGKRYTTNEGDKYICGIDDCTEYYDTYIKLLLFNIKCKHDIDTKAKSTAFYVLKQYFEVPFELRNIIKEFL